MKLTILEIILNINNVLFTTTVSTRLIFIEQLPYLLSFSKDGIAHWFWSAEQYIQLYTLSNQCTLNHYDWWQWRLINSVMM